MYTSEKYYLELGKLVDESSEAEKWLKRYIGQVATIEEEMCFRIFAGIRVNSLINILASVFDYKFKDAKLHEQLTTLLGELDTNIKRRDEFIHSHWIFWDAYDVVVSEKNKIRSRKFVKGRRSPKLQEIQGTRINIYNIRVAIGSFITKARFGLPIDI